MAIAGARRLLSFEFELAIVPQDPYRLPSKCRDKHRAVEFLVERNVPVSLLQNPDHAKRFQSGRLGGTLGTFKLNDRLRGPRTPAIFQPTHARNLLKVFSVYRFHTFVDYCRRPF